MEVKQGRSENVETNLDEGWTCLALLQQQNWEYDMEVDFGKNTALIIKERSNFISVIKKTAKSKTKIKFH